MNDKQIDCAFGMDNGHVQIMMIKRISTWFWSSPDA